MRITHFAVSPSFLFRSSHCMLRHHLSIHGSKHCFHYCSSGYLHSLTIPAAHTFIGRFESFSVPAFPTMLKILQLPLQAYISVCNITTLASTISSRPPIRRTPQHC
ncbi:hypothetical protein HBI56_040630 [Parastagonospora nodorum]|uniref:Uncharacterized protein n=1 Tax=Phaeosphaeria nodorum (strain SN15 / ATCC MYA-4574 / FGSC 10173) TaxID=321614 RepID=A0A7U2EUG7_PHANO|nr:hypothetical protein HBH56_066140 [Parastagonospora nodorum]QRC93323.1 hypothetical protein JI435_403610 [Parastagonospora nodorum SN15]KAH3932288.1 hypothetical protein HBH54_081950 [Parastagonospora nodorum]KAH3954952.1 hypothetical protein HBH53_012440 [Parastagonospora nodorum]KAH3986269.1 hypothetical protein HBH52_043640 [Parastagonospora nodorum]